jgi:hypothetical protein
MTPDFSVAERATWPELLDVTQVAAIYRRAQRGVLDACARRLFQPARFQTHPSRWRKADVIRHLDGAFTARAMRRSA